MKIARRVTLALLACATALTVNVPAQAAPLAPGNGLQSAATDGVQTVQWRHRHHGPHWGHQHWRYRDYGWGPAIGGLAAGALIGGAIASSQAQAARGDAVAYCSQRFRSYDPASGTYLGYDGLRHPCP